jgi:putative membrane protein
MRRILGTACLMVIAGLSLAADDAKRDDQPVSDQDFVMKAASGGLFEVQSSTLAKEAAKDEAAKKFAERMIADHTKANEELMAAAKKANIDVPKKLADPHQKMLDDLSKRKGAEFDAAYWQSQVKAHDEAVALFTNASKNVKNAELKAFAEKTLPTIKEHQEHAKKHASERKDQ